MRDYFCGWYYKCQQGNNTLALIPSVHRVGNEYSGALQILTEEGAWSTKLPWELTPRIYKHGALKAGGNSFGPDGIKLNIRTGRLSAEGELRFGTLRPLRYDIMGPFAAVPFMECRHSVVSMLHSVSGEVRINGAACIFSNAAGYIEGDRGHSFPGEYLWTHCFFEGGSLMLSVAEIPFAGMTFTGVIGVLLYRGKEYRIATYLGAKTVKLSNGEVEVRQGKWTLYAKLLERKPSPLLAPVGGAMSRIVHESAACRAEYRFSIDGDTVFAFETDKASFEYEYSK